MDFLVKAKSKDGIWITGSISDFNFAMKVCDEASGFSIDEDRIVKLFVVSSTGQEIMAYERGWEIKPSHASEEELLQALLIFSHELPRQEVWKRSLSKTRKFLITDSEVLEYEE